MIHFTHAEIDHLITEDLPLHDETTRALGVPDVSGTLTYVARQPGVLAGLKPCLLMAQHLGLRAEALAQDGSALQAQQPVLRLHGGAHALHVAWRQGMSVLEYLGGIASTTASMLRAARQANPQVQLASTRKAFPGARRWQQYAVLCGGGMVHRAGLSESILVFAQHRTFLPDLTVAELVQRAKTASPEKFVMVEADDEADALAAVHAGADGVQLDKMPPPTGRPGAAPADGAPGRAPHGQRGGGHSGRQRCCLCRHGRGHSGYVQPLHRTGRRLCGPHADGSS
jgi:molybdenum transport protein